ncbi:hypothetical protein HYV22_04110 [Candidatus Gottesmanbacteria bacterium]|nr:hypothetical protein [Candidatus Gottesmanbacteria bacterium]
MAFEESRPEQEGMDEDKTFFEQTKEQQEEDALEAQKAAEAEKGNKKAA